MMEGFQAKNLPLAACWLIHQDSLLHQIDFLKHPRFLSMSLLLRSPLPVEVRKGRKVC